MIGNFQAARNATDTEILAFAEADIEKFYQKHMPDGTARPKVINFHKGVLRLFLD
jgi:hypothetical protein